MDWVTTLLAGLAAAGVAGREGINMYRGTSSGAQIPPETLDQLRALISTVEKLGNLFEGLTPSELKEALDQIENTDKIVDREDADVPGQKLVWSEKKTIRALAENVEQQTRILKSAVDILRAMEGEIRSLKTLVELGLKK